MVLATMSTLTIQQTNYFFLNNCPYKCVPLQLFWGELSSREGMRAIHKRWLSGSLARARRNICYYIEEGKQLWKLVLILAFSHKVTEVVLSSVKRKMEEGVNHLLPSFVQVREIWTPHPTVAAKCIPQTSTPTAPYALNTVLLLIS